MRNRGVIFVFIKKLFYSLLTIGLISACTQKAPEVFIPKNIVIAHRGSTYWTPEETEAAFRWARNIGSDYLEVDIQRSKDGVLLALHDNNLMRTTNIEEVFGDRKQLPASEFTYEELMQLDAGSWFNKENGERARKGFTEETAEINKVMSPALFINDNGAVETHPLYSKTAYINGKQYISTLEDVIHIAEGYCIARDSMGKRLYRKSLVNGKAKYHFYFVKDPKENGNSPGVYIETKEPNLFPGVELDLFNELDRLHWNVVTKAVDDTLCYKDSKVRIGKTSARVILQTFSLNSLKKLNELFQKKVPTTLLLWLGDPNMMDNDKETYQKNLQMAHKLGAQIIGPSIAGAPNHYDELLSEDHYRWIKDKGFLIHPYSFDTDKQTIVYGDRCDGMFTNRAELTIAYYSISKKRTASKQSSAEAVLSYLGY